MRPSRLEARDEFKAPCNLPRNNAARKHSSRYIQTDCFCWPVANVRPSTIDDAVPQLRVPQQPRDAGLPERFVGHVGSCNPKSLRTFFICVAGEGGETRWETLSTARLEESTAWHYKTRCHPACCVRSVFGRRGSWHMLLPGRERAPCAHGDIPVRAHRALRARKAMLMHKGGSQGRCARTEA